MAPACRLVSTKQTATKKLKIKCLLTKQRPALAWPAQHVDGPMPSLRGRFREVVYGGWKIETTQCGLGESRVKYLYGPRTEGVAGRW